MMCGSEGDDEKEMNKKVTNHIPEEMLGRILKLGYQPVTPEDQTVFDPYYDRMDRYWAASSSFVNMIAWHASLPFFYKISGDMIVAICYESNEKILVGVPFVGLYTEDSVAAAFAVLRRDFEEIGEPLVIMDVTRWMLPYYERLGSFEIEDRRDFMEYIYTAKAFEEGMERQDDRYRRNYFMRRFDYEAVEIQTTHKDEIRAFMDDYWCGTRKCEDCQYGCLADVTDSVVEAFDRLHVNGILVRVDGKAAGFCIVTNRSGQAIYQFKNAINRIKGINEYLLKECYDRYLKGADIINYTEDCGIESLRNYKMKLCREYTLSSRLTLYERRRETDAG